METAAAGKTDLLPRPPPGPPWAWAVITHPSAHPDPSDPFPALLPFHHPFVAGDVPSIQKFVDGGVLGASRQGVKGERPCECDQLSQLPSTVLV